MELKYFENMSNEELREALEEIERVIDARKNKERAEAIENFKKAFNELQKHVWLIEIDTGDSFYPVDNVNDFYFEG